MLSGDDDKCRHLPFCAVARIARVRRIPRAAGQYRDIRANMEQTSACIGLDHYAEGVRAVAGEPITIVGKGIDAWRDAIRRARSESGGSCRHCS